MSVRLMGLADYAAPVKMDPKRKFLTLLLLGSALFYFGLQLFLTAPISLVPRFIMTNGGDKSTELPKEDTLIYCNTFDRENTNKSDCGKKFSSTFIPYLQQFNLSDQQVNPMTEEDDNRILQTRPIFVTAFDDSHFRVAMDGMFKSFIALFPSEQFLVYDLGLSQITQQKLLNMSCVHSIRQFNFSNYPSYVSNLMEYRWKPLIMAEVLQEFEALFYVDAHIVWKKEGDFTDLLRHIHCQINGCGYYSSLLMGNTGHSIFVTTDQRLYDYLPMRSDQTKKVEMGEGGFQLSYYTRDVRSNIHKWYVLCALEENCMAPKGATVGCKFGKDRWNYYGHCHRYDQSVVNILLANRNQYNRTRYFVEFAHTRT